MSVLPIVVGSLSMSRFTKQSTKGSSLFCSISLLNCIYVSSLLACSWKTSISSVCSCERVIPRVVSGFSMYC